MSPSGENKNAKGSVTTPFPAQISHGYNPSSVGVGAGVGNGEGAGDGCAVGTVVDEGKYRCRQKKMEVLLRLVRKYRGRINENVSKTKQNRTEQ